MADHEERCKVRVRTDPWYSHACGRKVKPGETKCGIHLAAEKRHQESQAKHQAEYEQQEQLRQHLREVAKEFEDRYGVTLDAHFRRVGGDYKLSGLFVISEEALRKLVRGRG